MFGLLKEGAFPYLISHINYCMQIGFGCNHNATGHAAGARCLLRSHSFDIADEVAGGGAEGAVNRRSPQPRSRDGNGLLHAKSTDLRFPSCTGLVPARKLLLDHATPMGT